MEAQRISSYCIFTDLNIATPNSRTETVSFWNESSPRDMLRR